MSYKPDSRLLNIFNEVESGESETIAEICPLFSELSENACRYEKQELLGSGGLKDVFKAFDSKTRQWVALAKLRDDRNFSYYDLFVREAWLTSSLSHPNIIKIHDAGIDENDRPFFTMDLKRGTSFNDLIKSDDFSRSDLLSIFLKVCDAVSYAHSQGIVHLDLKPENIQCDRFGEVLVCDWGLGRQIQEDCDVFDGLPKQRVAAETMVGRVCGTIGFMAPEQLSSSPKSEHADIYALGCILYAILTGEPPFRGEFSEVAEAMKTDGICGFRSKFKNRRIPVALEAVVLKATSKTPSERYSSVADLKNEIQKYLAGFSTAAEKSSIFKELILWVRRHKKSVAIVSFATFAIAILSTVFFIRLNSHKMATAEERVRANELFNKVNSISTEFANFFQESEVSKKELSRKLIWSANNLKEFGSFDKPRNFIGEAQQMIDMALDLDPTSGEAKWQRFTLYSLQLNYKQALSVSIESSPESLRGMITLAKSFPDFNYSLKNRPDTTVMVDFFENAQKLKGRPLGYVERMFSLHCKHSNKNRSGLIEEVTAFIEYYNGGPNVCSIFCDKKTERAIVAFSKNNPVFRLRSGGGSGQSFLRFLPIRHLEIDVDGKLDLINLNGLGIETLDLRDCEFIENNQPVYLPKLNKIILRSDQKIENLAEIKTNQKLVVHNL